MRTGLMWTALSGLLLSACTAAPGASAQLDGSHWQLQSADRGDLEPLAIGSGVTLKFTAEKASGYSGCNNYSAKYSLKDNTLTLGPVGATKRGCADDAAKVERAWFALLAAPLAVKIEGESLELRGPDGTVLRLTPAGKTQ